MPEFIFMLTHDDRTVPDALARLPEVLAAGVTRIGFKDVGLPGDELARLAEAIHRAGATSYLEVVSLDAASEARSARAALAHRVDWLLGGTHPDAVLPVIAGAPIRYCPFPGRVVGHPSRLEGSADEIAASARALPPRPGVAGLDLLAYRSPLGGEALIAEVCRAAAPKPVIVAGSIDRAERIAELARAGAAAFTIGTAALDGAFPAPSSALVDQLAAIQALALQPSG